jgi:plasmid stability protein
MNENFHQGRRPARQWRQTHLRLPDDLHQRLEQKAKASERTLAGEMRLRLQHSLASEEGEKQVVARYDHDHEPTV